MGGLGGVVEGLRSGVGLNNGATRASLPRAGFWRRNKLGTKQPSPGSSQPRAPTPQLQLL
jgi:hypothetical protein